VKTKAVLSVLQPNSQFCALYSLITATVFAMCPREHTSLRGISSSPYAVACQFFHIVCTDCWYLHHGYGLVCLVRRTVNSLIWDSIVHVEVRANIFYVDPWSHCLSCLASFPGRIFGSDTMGASMFLLDHPCFPIPFRQVMASSCYCD